MIFWFWPNILLKNFINLNYPDIIWFNKGIFCITNFNTSYSTNNYEISIESLNNNELPNNGKLNLDNLDKDILFNVIIKNKETNSVKNIMLSSVVNCEQN